MVEDTKGKGHVGVKQDVQRIWENCSTFLGEDSDLAKTGRQLEILFGAFYSHRILGAMDQTQRLPSSLLIEKMGTTSYQCLSYEEKLDILDWLVDEVITTSEFRSYIDEIAELRQKTARLKRSTPSGEQTALSNKS